MPTNLDAPLIGPGPRPWWHVPAWIAAGVIVVGGGTFGVIQATHHPAKLADPPKNTVHFPKKLPPSKFQPLASTPNYVPKTQPTGPIFQAMAAINNKYIAYGDQQITQAIPSIPSSGPGAGTLTPSILNSPWVLKHYPGPKVPMSLQAVGVKLPQGTPVNGSVVGLSMPEMSAILAANHFWPGLTPQQLYQAFETAGQYVLANGGNNPSSAFQYMDPYADGGKEDQTYVAGRNGNIASDFTMSAAQGGMLPLRQVNYDTWVSYAINATNVDQSLSGVDMYQPAVTRPTGHVVIGTLGIRGVGINTIGTGMVNGKLVIGKFTGNVGQVSLALIKDGTQERWYVTADSGNQFNNTPSQTFWTAPK